MLAIDLLVDQVHRHAGVVRPLQRDDELVLPRDADMALLRYLAVLLEAVVEETGISTPTAIIEEFESESATRSLAGSWRWAAAWRSAWPVTAGSSPMCRVKERRRPFTCRR